MPVYSSLLSADEIDLFRAAQTGNIGLAKATVAKETNVNVCPTETCQNLSMLEFSVVYHTPLLIAVKYNHFFLAAYLIFVAKANFNLYTDTAMSVIGLAKLLVKGPEEAFNLLQRIFKEKRALVTLRFLQEAFCHALEIKNFLCVEFLTQFISPDDRLIKERAFYEAICRQELPVIRWLVKVLKTSVNNFVDDSLQTPLTTAIANHNPQVAKWLIVHGAEIEKPTDYVFSAPVAAIYYKNLYALQLLISLDIKSVGPYTASRISLFHDACNMWSFKCLSWLLLNNNLPSNIALIKFPATQDSPALLPLKKLELIEKDPSFETIPDEEKEAFHEARNLVCRATLWGKSGGVRSRRRLAILLHRTTTEMTTISLEPNP